MLPALGLVRFGTGRWTVPLPLPLFLAWPFVLLALGVVMVGRQVVPERDGVVAGLAIAQTALLVLFSLSGLRVDVHAKDGTRVQVWLW